ncbi:MAG: glycosyltransferase family 2 protein [Pseudolabrys sp.]|nr:glycosyltransferase family 2 protein [Pseudolabrys sp.]
MPVAHGEGQSTSEEREIALLTPASDAHDPEFSIVVPALNEEITIGKFVDWCNEGISRAGVAAEVLIVDSSTDRTAEIALAHGARVLKVPRRGLGRAYIDAIAHARGRYVIMGDADCTYDFRRLEEFVAKFRAGYEFIMGSRFAGSIEEGAMPALHRYFGTPLTTMILNFVYRTSYSDIQCGMRGLTKDAWQRLGMTAQGWEYAPEMIVKARQIKLRSAEVPIHFYKDQKGRLSHLKRGGWVTPWRAGWHTLKVILTYGAERVIQPISLFLSILGLAGLVALSSGPVRVFGVTLTLHTMLLASTFLIIGLVLSGISILSICINDRTGNDVSRWAERFQFTRSMKISLLLFVAGFAICASFAAKYVASGFIFRDDAAWIGHLSVIGLTMIIVSILIAGFSILLQALVDRIRILDR